MTDNEHAGSIFQAGIILGRIMQYCVDRKAVHSPSELGLADFLILLSEEIRILPLNEPLAGKIQSEITGISTNLSAYPPDKPLEADDARIMIGLAGRWSDMILNELGYKGFVTEPTINTDLTEGGDPGRDQDPKVDLKEETTPGKNQKREDTQTLPQKKTSKKSLCSGSKRC
ncbi:MAG: hypothetical protein LUQ31_07825 [Methanoregula sp.]|nr:hypothetical protein [Methanoregula sp.]